MAEDQDERTEQATDTRREEFRRRGQVAMTRELATAAVFLTAAGVLFALGRYFFQNLQEVFDHSFGIEMLKVVKSEVLTDIIWFFGKKVMFLIAPVFAITMVIGVAAQVLQTGFLQVEDALSFDLNKLNPLNSLGRIFSMKGVIEILKSIIKMIIVFVSIYMLLKSEVRQIPYLSGYGLQELFSYFGSVLFKLLLGTGIFMLVLAVGDYFFQRWQLEKVTLAWTMSSCLTPRLDSRN